MKESMSKNKKINNYKMLIRKLRLEKEGALIEKIDNKKTNRD